MLVEKYSGQAELSLALIRSKLISTLRREENPMSAFPHFTLLSHSLNIVAAPMNDGILQIWQFQVELVIAVNITV